jgi:hypothetical protein
VKDRDKTPRITGVILIILGLGHFKEKRKIFKDEVGGNTRSFQDVNIEVR